MNHSAPPPSSLPLCLAAAVTAALLGLVLYGHENTLGLPVFITGSIILLLSLLATFSSTSTSTSTSSPSVSKAALFLLLADLIISATLIVFLFYIVSGARQWPPAGTPPLEPAAPIAATIVLALSAALPEIARRALVARRLVFFRVLMIGTAAVGALVMGVMTWHLARMHFGFEMSTNANVLAALWWISNLWVLAHVGGGVLFLLAAAAKAEAPALETARVFWRLTAALAIVVLFTIHLGGMG